jgi:hypothetical protein
MRWSLVRNLLTSVRSTNRCPRRRPAVPRVRPRLEVLEGRCLLSGGISLTPSEAAPQLVGEPITWAATVPDASPGLVHQFSVGSPGGPFQMVRDFSPDDSFTWTPMQEGTYRIRVAVKDGFGASDIQPTVVTDKVDSRVTGDQAVITPTANPLVALYSVPPGPVGTVHVEFAAAGDNPSWRSTNEMPSLPSRSTNFFVAGMLPSTTYEMRDVFSDGTTAADGGGAAALDPGANELPPTGPALDQVFMAPGVATPRDALAGDHALVAELPSAFQGLDVAVVRFIPTAPCPVVSPVFALNFGEASPETVPALAGLQQAVGQIPPNPISPVFFALADGTPTVPAGPSPDAVDEVFAGLGAGTDEALWAF